MLVKYAAVFLVVVTVAFGSPIHTFDDEKYDASSYDDSISYSEPTVFSDSSNENLNYYRYDTAGSSLTPVKLPSPPIGIQLLPQDQQKQSYRKLKRIQRPASTQNNHNSYSETCPSNICYVIRRVYNNQTGQFELQSFAYHKNDSDFINGNNKPNNFAR